MKKIIFTSLIVSSPLIAVVACSASNIPHTLNDENILNHKSSYQKLIVDKYTFTLSIGNSSDNKRTFGVFGNNKTVVFKQLIDLKNYYGFLYESFLIDDTHKFRIKAIEHPDKYKLKISDKIFDTKDEAQEEWLKEFKFFKKDDPFRESLKDGDALEWYVDSDAYVDYKYENGKWIDLDTKKPSSKLLEPIYFYVNFGNRRWFTNKPTYSRTDTHEIRSSMKNLFSWKHDYDVIKQPDSYLLEKIENDKNGNETKTTIDFIDLEKLGITKKTTRLDTDYLYDLDN